MAEEANLKFKNQKRLYQDIILLYQKTRAVSWISYTAL